jgi:tetratricopeptide (TPR) repeat protein
MKNLLVATLILISSAVFAQDAERSFKAGENFYNSGNYTRAIDHYTEAITTDPNYLNAYLRRAFCYTANKQYTKAITDYSKIIKDQSNNVWALNSRGSAYNKIEKYDKAIADFNRVISIDPSFSEAYNNRGMSKKLKGDKKGACSDWKKSKKLGNGESKIILKNNGC